MKPHLAKNDANLGSVCFFFLPQTPFKLATFILFLVLSIMKWSPWVFSSYIPTFLALSINPHNFFRLCESAILPRSLNEFTLGVWFIMLSTARFLLGTALVPGRTLRFTTVCRFQAYGETHNKVIGSRLKRLWIKRDVIFFTLNTVCLFLFLVPASRRLLCSSQAELWVGNWMRPQSL